MSTDLGILIAKQLGLQVEKMKDGDPRFLVGSARADFMRWNVLALEDELHEMLGEFKWKPWATDEGSFLDRDLALKEMVDAFHFFMNLILVIAGPGIDPDALAQKFSELYFEKNAINAQRQDDGYSGQKCPTCGREVEAAKLIGEDVSIHTKFYRCPCDTAYQVSTN